MRVASVIYSRGGFAFTYSQELGYCGTNDILPIITNFKGQGLYSANCASCHSITKELTGPALTGFNKRISSELFYLLIQNPKQAYKKSKYLSQLKKQYDIEHSAFPSLTKKDINDIKQYVVEAGSDVR